MTKLIKLEVSVLFVLVKRERSARVSKMNKWIFVILALEILTTFTDVSADKPKSKSSTRQRKKQFERANNHREIENSETDLEYHDRLVRANDFDHANNKKSTKKMTFSTIDSFILNNSSRIDSSKISSPKTNFLKIRSSKIDTSNVRSSKVDSSKITKLLRKHIINTYVLDNYQRSEKNWFEDDEDSNLTDKALKFFTIFFDLTKTSKGMNDCLKILLERMINVCEVLKRSNENGKDDNAEGEKSDEEIGIDEAMFIDLKRLSEESGIESESKELTDTKSEDSEDEEKSNEKIDSNDGMFIDLRRLNKESGMKSESKKLNETIDNNLDAINKILNFSKNHKESSKQISRGTIGKKLANTDSENVLFTENVNNDVEKEISTSKTIIDLTTQDFYSKTTRDIFDKEESTMAKTEEFFKMKLPNDEEKYIESTTRMIDKMSNKENTSEIEFTTIDDFFSSTNKFNEIEAEDLKITKLPNTETTKSDVNNLIEMFNSTSIEKSIEEDKNGKINANKHINMIELNDNHTKNVIPDIEITMRFRSNDSYESNSPNNDEKLEKDRFNHHKKIDNPVKIVNKMRKNEIFNETNIFENDHFDEKKIANRSSLMKNLQKSVVPTVKRKFPCPYNNANKSSKLSKKSSRKNLTIVKEPKLKSKNYLMDILTESVNPILEVSSTTLKSVNREKILQ